MLAVVFAFDKLRPYLIGTDVIVYIDHAATRYLFAKKDAKRGSLDGSYFYKSLILKSNIRMKVKIQ